MQPNNQQESMMPKKTFYRIEVALAECPFEVTRTLIVPADIRLDYLHEVLQTAMGWRNSHLHEFQSKTKRYGVKSGEDDEISDERRVRLSGIVKPKDPYCGYIYDYGDEWVHQLHVVDFDCGGVPPKRWIACIGGKGACPPEDVGGTTGYADFCAAINDPENPEHDEQAEWVYDICQYHRSLKWPDGFDQKDIDGELYAVERWYRRETAPKKPKPPRMWVYVGKK